MANLSYNFTFISLEDSSDLGLLFTGDINDFENLVSTLKLGIFGRPDVNDGIAYFIRSSETLYDNLCNLASYLSYLKCPKINALPAWIKKLGNDKFFTVVTNREVTQEESFAIRAKIEELQFGTPFEQTMEQVKELTESIYSNYSIIAHDGHKRVYIGETRKELRVCRYCHRTQASGSTFKKIGHTISEGLGNKNIITNDECDECNEYFGINIEPALIHYIDPLRVIFGVQGKEHKITKIKGDNFEIEATPAEGTKTFNIKIFEEPKGDANLHELILSLKHAVTIIPQNIYKTLVKYAFGIIPNEKLDHFSETANWLLGKSEHLPLPPVRFAYVNGYEPSPRIVLYLRNNDNASLPFALGELHVLNLIYLYVVPTFTDDEKLFLNPDGWCTLLDNMKYWKCLNWHWKNLSSMNPIQPVMNFNIDKKE